MALKINLDIPFFIPIFASENNRDMSIKDKLFRILAEQDLYKQGESDTINSVKFSGIKYKITFSDGWWDLEKTSENKVLVKVALLSLAKLVRTVLRNEDIKY